MRNALEDNPDFLRAALDYAAGGNAIFPCQPGAKEPACPNGFKEATDDQATIERWWRENPNYNIGMVPARNDWIVLDLDLYKGVDEDLTAQLQRTHTVGTPSGGQHLRYRSTEKFGNCRLAKNVDVRSSAGYVLVPPSVVAGKAYRVEIDMEPAPLPLWVADRLHAAAQRQRERKEQTWNEGNDNPANVERGRQRLQSDCEHKPGFEIACILRRDLGLSGDKATELWQEWQAEIVWQWHDDDIERNLINAGRYGQNEPGLHAVRPASEVFNLPAERRKVEIPTGLTLFRGRAEAMNQPAPKMLVERIIPAGKLILPYGGTGDGKTYFVVEIATAVAMRRPAFGEFKVLAPGEAGVVVIFAGEDCRELDQSRLVAIEQHYARSLEGLVFTTDLAIPLTDPTLFARYRDELKLIQDMTGKPIDLIVNDTLGRSIHGLNPNDQETGHIFTAGMEGLIQEFNTTLICSAHRPKSDSSTISGTQVFLDNVPVTPHIEGHRTGGNQLTGFTVTMEPKFRVGPPPKPFTVRALAVVLPKPVNGAHTDMIFSVSAGEQCHKRNSQRGKRERVINALARLTKTADDYVTTGALAMDLNAQEADEDHAEYQLRIREAEKTLARDIKGRDEKPGPLADLAKLTSNGTPYRPYRIFLPDSLRP
jgi:hypothetical protein